MAHVPYEREESEAQQLDRNWSELVQELRVISFGVQVLFAFLLTTPFQARFQPAGPAQRTVYLVTLLSAAVAAGLLITPVAIHRFTFRERVKDEVVRATAVLAVAGMAALMVTMAGAVLLVTEKVEGWGVAAACAGGVLVVLSSLWLLVPARMRTIGLHRRSAAADR